MYTVTEYDMTIACNPFKRALLAGRKLFYLVLAMVSM